MKRKLHKTLALLPLAAACAAVGSSAQAQAVISTPSEVHFVGKVVKASCTVSINGGNTVNLPLITSADLTDTVGKTVGEKAFVIEATGCGKNPGIFAKAYFYNTTSGAVTDTRLNITSGDGKGWQYELLPESGTTPLQVGTAATPVITSAADLGKDLVNGDGDLDLTYRVRYYRTADTFGAGVGNATANYVLYVQ